MRINQFQNIQLLNTCLTNAGAFTTNEVYLQGVYIEGSLSFNKVAVIVSASGTVSENLSLSFGLYSLNGSSLSLANSASMATAVTLNQSMYSWLTLSTSAIQDITPGNWYLGFQYSSSLGNNFSFIEKAEVRFVVAQPGFLASGFYTNATAGLPGSIATSDVSKFTAKSAVFNFPYILISA